MTQQQRQDIIRMWAQGMSGKQIAKQLGIKTASVFNFAKNHRDLCPYRKQPAVPEEYAEMMTLWRQGASVKQMADRFGVTKATMATRIYRNRELFPYRYRVKKVRDAEGTDE